MTQYPLWLQSDITAASTAEGWQERREKTLAALKKVKDAARTDPLTEVVYGLAVQLALMDDEAAEMRRKARALDDQVFFTQARVDGLWETLKEMRDGAPADEGDDDARKYDTLREIEKIEKRERWEYIGNQANISPCQGRDPRVPWSDIPCYNGNCPGYVRGECPFHVDRSLRPELKSEFRDKTASSSPDDAALLERLAAQEHDQWAHWTAYFLANMTPENIERWRRQVETPYAELSEKEKESDREWARKVVQIVRASPEP